LENSIGRKFVSCEETIMLDAYGEPKGSSQQKSDAFEV
jgi:hypothetical protein